MKALAQRHIRSGRQYDHLFPQSDGNDICIKKGATLDDTMLLIPHVVRDTLPQTRRVSKKLEGKDLEETCRNIWTFIFRHIQYKPDTAGKEEVRSPARSWADRKKGVDCDCYSVMISGILTNLGIDHSLRVTKNDKNYFQHIYVIVPDKRGGYITIDPVLTVFDVEAPFKQKIDKKMDLYYLNGVEMDTLNTNSPQGMNSFDLLDGAGNGLGLFKNLGKKLKKGLHAINRFNPVTVLLRNGLLASMRLNLKNVAGRLRFAYLTEQQARAMRLNMAQYRQLLQVREKLEKIFWTAGGKKENLKKAILTGKGNRDKKVPVSGLSGWLSGEPGFSEESSLREVLGEELFIEEVTDVPVSGVGALGEPVTLAASLAAAAAVVAKISGILDKVGKVSAQAKQIVNTVKEPVPSKSGSSFIQPSTVRRVDMVRSESNGSSVQPQVKRQSLPVTFSNEPAPSTPQPPQQQITEPEPAPEKEASFLDKAGAWVKENPGWAVLIGATVVGGSIYLGSKALGGSRSKAVSGVNGLEGCSKSYRKKKVKRKHRKRKRVHKAVSGVKSGLVEGVAMV